MLTGPKLGIPLIAKGKVPLELENDSTASGYINQRM